MIFEIFLDIINFVSSSAFFKLQCMCILFRFLSTLQNLKMSVTDVCEAPIIHVFVIGFHHKKGCVVSICFQNFYNLICKNFLRTYFFILL